MHIVLRQRLRYRLPADAKLRSYSFVINEENIDATLTLGEEVLENMCDEESYDAIDVSYFFGEEADSVCVNHVMYPDKAIIERCAMMHDTDTEALLKMWSRIKGDNASAWTYILICLVFGALVAALIVKYTKQARRRKRYAKRRRRK